MGGHGEFHAPKQATQEEMAAAKLDIAYRDSCAALLIPLNQCRYEQMYKKTACMHEKHEYEKCQYFEFLQRVETLKSRK